MSHATSELRLCDHALAAEALAALAARSAGAMNISQAERFIRGLDSPHVPAAGLGGPSDPFVEHWVVYRAVSKLAQAVGSIPMRLSRPAPAGGSPAAQAFGMERVRFGARRCTAIRGERAAHRAVPGQIVEGGELYELLKRPNSDQTWQQFASQFIGLAKTSRFVLMLLLDMVGRRPRELRLLGDEQAEPVLARGPFGDRLLGWRVRGTDGSITTVDRDDAIALVNFNPADPLAGLSPLRPASLAIVSAYNAEVYNASAFANSCEPGLVLTTEAEYDATVDADIRRKLIERHAGASRAKRPLILWGGMTVADASMSRSLADMEWTEGQRLKARQVCATLEVDEVVIGLYTDANYQFAEQGRMNFWQDAVLPWADQLAGLLAVHLAPRFVGELDVWADVERIPIVQKMRLSRLEAADKLWAKGVPLADCNDMLDLGVPDRPWHHVGFLPVGLQPAGEAAAGAVGVQLPADENEPDDGLSEPEQGPGAGDQPGKAADARHPTPETLSPAQRAANDRAWQAWMRSWSPLARAFQQALRARYATQERLVVAAVRKHGPKDAKAAAARTRDDGLIGRILLAITDAADKKAWRAKVAKFIADANELGLRQALIEAGVEGDKLEQTVKRLLANPKLLDAVRSEALVLSTRIDDATRRVLRTSLAEGLEHGETALELANRVQDVMGNRRAAAVTIARNSMGQALSSARFAGQREAGMQVKFWIHSRGPGKRRAAHVAAEAAYRAGLPIDEPFVINGVALQYPRDAAGSPAEIVNCMCLCVARAKAPAAGQGPAPARFADYAEMLAARQARDGEPYPLDGGAA